MHIITTNPTELPVSNITSIFLAGGCTTNWRDILIQEFTATINSVNKSAKYELSQNVVNFITLFINSKDIKLQDLLEWEHNAIIDADYVVFNFEGSSSVQPGSLYELGRYSPLIKGKIMVNADPNYSKLRELTYHIDMLNKDFGLGIELSQYTTDQFKNFAAELAWNIKIPFEAF